MHVILLFAFVVVVPLSKIKSICGFYVLCLVLCLFKKKELKLPLNDIADERNYDILSRSHDRTKNPCARVSTNILPSLF